MDLEFEEVNKVYLKISPMKGVVRFCKKVFLVSMLKKCIGDPESIISIEGFGVKDNLSYEEVAVQILDWQIKKLRNKEVFSEKVFWKNYLVEGATWEVEAEMKSHYPNLF
ncbi:uncharacterized protein [Solanum lycopersicum]|uniref:uncharacterized protein n=1 Tax=Solanum lycopersicum TaxID=4081 RepID=UPI003747B97F